MTYDFVAHPHREEVLKEVHARPFHPIKTPSRFLHYAFMTSAEQAADDRKAFQLFCLFNSAPPPPFWAKHHRVQIGKSTVQWEQHTEFTTYTWELATSNAHPFENVAGDVEIGMNKISQPGPLLVAIDLHLVAAGILTNVEAIFEHSSLAMARVDRNSALIATDFRADANGVVRLLVEDRGLTPARAGALVQRLLEIETYRMLALLGWPEAQKVSPAVKIIEDTLVRIARSMTETEGLSADHALLNELTTLAATLEAESAVSGYRFGASRAYDSIVQQRLKAIGEEPIDGWPTFEAFLARRMAPAMRTCAMLEERQANLSRKLTRATNLLRTRVDVEIEQQNRDLLASMNKRARMQLRLQQTVEGLSVAAISYYVVGLAGYVFKGAKESGYFPLESSIATALVVPVALIAVAVVVARIRLLHGKHDD